MELIQQLVSSLGVNEDQAKGGAGLLFNLAKDKLVLEISNRSRIRFQE